MADQMDAAWHPHGGDPFSVRSAVAAGASRSSLRSRRLAAPFHGLRAASDHPLVELLQRPDVDPDDGDDQWSAIRRRLVARAVLFAPKLPPSAAYSHATAAQLHAFSLPPRLALDSRLHIATPFRGERTRIRGVIAHVTPRHRLHIGEVEGVHCSAPVDTWLQLAAAMSVNEIVELGDQLVRRQQPMATIDDLERATGSSAGRHGITRARAAIAFIRSGTDSPRETRTRLAIIDGGLPEPHVNAVILDRDGGYLRRGDLVYPRWRVLVEYDGDGHRTDRAQFRLDIDVHEWLRTEGWVVVRIHGGHTAADVVRLVERALRSGGWR